MLPALIFGEVLFDRFESGETVLGGAPLNVAWHLHALGLEPILVSRLGDDELGRQALSTIDEFGLRSDFIQRDPQKPTGTVNITLSQASTTFEIVSDVAYDYIDDPATYASSQAFGEQPFSLLYHGSLALRSNHSRATLEALRARTDCPVFVDVNLRAPFWKKSLIASLIDAADWVKLNHEELMIMVDKPVTQQRDNLIESARTLNEQYDLRALIVTCGDQGAFIVHGDEVVDMPPVVPEKMVDTVGWIQRRDDCWNFAGLAI